MYSDQRKEWNTAWTLRCRKEINDARKECAEKTKLTVEQVIILQERGFAISEIMAGHVEGKKFVPKELIKVVPHFTLLA